MSAAARIVSLLPSATEMICALGLRDRLVGVSHECDFPGDVRGLPVLTAAKLDARGSSAQIDRDVRAIVRDGLGVYRIETDRLRELRPDLVVTQDQCDVCAVSYQDVLRATRALFGDAVAVVSLRPTRLDDVLTDVQKVADAAGVPERGRSLRERLSQRLAALAARTRSLVRPRLGFIEWIEPLMAGGNWVPELADLAGATYSAVQPGGPSETMDLDTLAASEPEVLCIAPCGFPLAQTARELPGLVRSPGWQDLPAVRSGRVFAVDGNAYFNRPGPRLVESAEILAALCHPGTLGDLLPAGAACSVDHEGRVTALARRAS